MTHVVSTSQFVSFCRYQLLPSSKLDELTQVKLYSSLHMCEDIRCSQAGASSASFAGAGVQRHVVHGLTPKRLVLTPCSNYDARRHMRMLSQRFLIQERSVETDSCWEITLSKKHGAHDAATGQGAEQDPCVE